MAVKGAGKGILSPSEKVIIVLALRVRWWQRVARQIVGGGNMRRNEWEQTLGGRPKNNNVSVDGYIKVPIAAHKTLQTRKPRCGSGPGWKLTRPNQLSHRLGEPRRPGRVLPESMRSLDVNT